MRDFRTTTPASSGVQWVDKAGLEAMVSSCGSHARPGPEAELEAPVAPPLGDSASLASSCAMANAALSEPPGLPCTAFRAQLEAPAEQQLVVDVREEAEVAATGMLHPSVEHIPLGSLEEEIKHLAEERADALDAPLVFSCAAGVRSNFAAQMALAAGFTNVFSYVGGANEWFR